MKEFTHAIVGGTFDHLHRGHEALLGATLEKAAAVTVALATQEFAARKELAHLIQPFGVRFQRLKTFLSAYPNDAAILPLHDPYNPAAHEESFDALFASSGTHANIARIQTLRRRGRLPLLKTFFVEPMKDTSGTVLSSARIRRGVVDRDGFWYPSLLEKTKRLPEAARDALKHPLGDCLSKEETLNRIRLHKPFLMITVGDVSTASFKDGSYRPHLSVFDLRSRRSVFARSAAALGAPEPDCLVENPPGHVTARMSTAIRKSIDGLVQNPGKRVSVRVEGEEDLAVLPAVLHAPLTSVVLYGQPDRGLVYVDVNEDMKKRVRDLLEHV